MIVINKIQCVRCKSIIESRHDNDSVQCACKAVAVDGGHSYLRRIGKDDDIIELSEFDGETVYTPHADELAVFPSLERLRAVRSNPDPNQLFVQGVVPFPS